MNTFLQSVGAVLTTGLKATVQLEGLADGNIKLIYTPEIGPTPENASEAVVQLRAAISKPMVVSGAPAEIEEAFANLIASKAAVVARGLSALDEIERLANAAVGEAKAKPSATPPTAPHASDDDDDDDGDEGEAEASAINPSSAPATAPAVPGAAASQF
ncbi:PRTRC system protein E [Pseudomonas mosselii]|uniref:PRTRC system protein E n=1 Tax=Pseudomonas mosselii TaxID=78327 RepID=UPI0021D9D371|nr:PRTRC system protein E [Pseudomonas mosselii]MCU9528511.1 PRTRC system protein E [Pseudomonas mosselii]MCU9535845.1 PRTRC system protein E [Pseudomonas mosselii]MCU9542903.1 PRTRC system protein E [Pseudomonas mosselii]MCU9548784.1 PRTRC system protein E [Pseudomonas mosselii]